MDTNRPLAGKKIVVTRARAQADDLAEQIEAAGGQVFEFPTIEIQPPEQAPGQQQQLVMEQINDLVIANLQAVFSQPLPQGIAVALISQIADANDDGFEDVTVLIGLRSGRGRRGGSIQIFSVTFDGVSTSGALIGQPTLLGTV